MSSYSHSLHGFSVNRVYSIRDPHAFRVLSQRVTFWIALLSVFAFVVGNMIGQHGWQVFWRSVWGKEDESQIVYTRRVPPIKMVPDCRKWSRYGGDGKLNTADQVPRDVWVPLPKYDPKTLGTRIQNGCLTFAVGHAGSYATGEANGGSHPGVDILTPTGTEVRAVMNGLVVAVADNPGGYGKHVVLKHPNVPEKGKKVTLYSIYAHLSSQLVSVGMVVNADDVIGLVGDTGFATAPHLHFQMDRDVSILTGEKTPFHPYWPFSSKEVAAAKLTFVAAINSGLNKEMLDKYTIDPMLYVQDTETIPVIAEVNAQSTSQFSQYSSEHPVVAAAMSSSSRSSAPAVTQLTQQVVTVELTLPQSFSGRKWEVMRVKLLDAQGNLVRSPNLEGDLHLRTAYGKAQFRPAVLSELDFQNGVATVRMLPIGRSTIIVSLQPVGAVSEPMRFAKK